MSDPLASAVWPQLLPDFILSAVLIAVVVAFGKYLDKWLSAYAISSEKAAEDRQTQILVLLERVLTAQSTSDKTLEDIVASNTKALDRVADVLTKQGETVAQLVTADLLQAQNLREITAIELEHFQDTASRPCQQGPPSKDRPPKPRPRGGE
jgi:hypothetical protein